MSTDSSFLAVRKDIAAAIPHEGYDDGSLGPVMVRLAWHASGASSLRSLELLINDAGLAR